MWKPLRSMRRYSGGEEESHWGLCGRDLASIAVWWAGPLMVDLVARGYRPLDPHKPADFSTNASLTKRFSPRQLGACEQQGLRRTSWSPRRWHCEQSPRAALLAWSESSLWTCPRSAFPLLQPILPCCSMLARTLPRAIPSVTREKDVLCREELGCAGKDMS